MHYYYYICYNITCITEILHVVITLLLCIYIYIYVIIIVLLYVQLQFSANTVNDDIVEIPHSNSGNSENSRKYRKYRDAHYCDRITVNTSFASILHWNRQF